MENYKQLSNIILKVKQWEELTPEEELVYLVHIEGYTEEDAIKKMIDWNYHTTFQYNSFHVTEHH